MTTMTETAPSQPGSPKATKRARTTNKRRRARPAAASRVLVIGLSVAATIGLAATMVQPTAEPAEPQPSAAAPDSQQVIPTTPVVTQTDQPAITTSNAS